MTSQDFADHLSSLGLDPSEAHQLLGVSARTLRRWLDGKDEEIPGPAEAALRAWRKLNDRYFPWRPDAVSVFDDDQDQIERHRRHTQAQAALIARVEARGGPQNPWRVDLARNRATFVPFEVSFYNLQSEGFLLSSYRRIDQPPDPDRDLPFLEDAAYCISEAFRKVRACGPALTAIAEYVRRHPSLFVVDGARMTSGPERARRKQEIDLLADQIDELKVLALRGKATYDEFEEILRKLHALGLFPEISLVSAVAKAMN